MSTPTIDDGGPAFPQPAFINSNGEVVTAGCYFGDVSGASLRDVFAGQMAAAIIAAGNANDQRATACEGGPQKLAIAAYVFADAMLAARKEPIKP